MDHLEGLVAVTTLPSRRVWAARFDRDAYMDRLRGGGGLRFDRRAAVVVVDPATDGTTGAHHHQSDDEPVGRSRRPSPGSEDGDDDRIRLTPRVVGHRFKPVRISAASNQGARRRFWCMTQLLLWFDLLRSKMLATIYSCKRRPQPHHIQNNLKK